MPVAYPPSVRLVTAAGGSLKGKPKKKANSRPYRGVRFHGKLSTV